MTTSVGPYRREILQIWDPDKGEPVPSQATERAVHTRPFPGPQRSPHNRELIKVNAPADGTDVQTSELHTTTWTKSENVTEVTVGVAYGATPTINYGSSTGEHPNADGVYVVFDSGSDAVSAYWLNEGSEGADSNLNTYRYYIPANSVRTFRFTGYILRVDAIAGVNSTNDDFDVVMEAN